MSDPSPLPDPGSTAIAAQTFKIARKGFDPDEVRTFLEEVQAAVRARDALAGAPAAPSPEALVEAQRVVASARQQAEAVLAAAPPSAAGAPGPPTGGEHAVTAAVRQADEIIGAASAQVDALRAEVAAPTDGAGDRWGDLGGHVARTLQGAEAEADRIGREAEELLARLAAQTAQDQATAAGLLAQAEAKAAAVLSAAEVDAGLLVQHAEPRIEAHLAHAHAQAEAERASGDAALVDAIGRLRDLQVALDQALAERAPTPGLPGPLHFLVAPPAAPGTAEHEPTSDLPAAPS